MAHKRTGGKVVEPHSAGDTTREPTFRAFGKAPLESGDLAARLSAVMNKGLRELIDRNKEHDDIARQKRDFVNFVREALSPLGGAVKGDPFISALLEENDEAIAMVVIISGRLRHPEKLGDLEKTGLKSLVEQRIEVDEGIVIIYAQYAKSVFFPDEGIGVIREAILELKPDEVKGLSEELWAIAANTPFSSIREAAIEKLREEAVDHIRHIREAIKTKIAEDGPPKPIGKEIRERIRRMIQTDEGLSKLVRWALEFREAGQKAKNDN